MYLKRGHVSFFEERTVFYSCSACVKIVAKNVVQHSFICR